MNTVDIWLMSNAKFFNTHQIIAVKHQIENMPTEKVAMLSAMGFSDPTIVLIISILAGVFGIDRFMIGDVGLGIAKLITCGGLGIWVVIDWFLIMNRARDKNFEKLMIGVSMYQA